MRTVALVVLLLASVGQAKDAPGYPFKVPPSKALVLLARLDPLGKTSLPLSTAEKRLLLDAEKGRLQLLSLAEAAILASGVSEYRKRKMYLDRYEKIFRAAREATDEYPGTRDKADALLRFLHASAFKGGYVHDHTRLTDILDDGTFNCVSASVLYNAIGSRLGLEVRGIVVKGHAFSAVLDDAQSIDVETTSPNGFNPDRPKRRVIWMERGVGVKVSEVDPTKVPRRVVREAGLIALIYANRSAMESRSKRYLAGAQLGMRALWLDPESAGAASNTRANLVNWVAHCITRCRFEEGLQVVRVGLEIDPSCEALLINRKGVYIRWAAKHLEDGSEPKAQAVLKRAAKDVPGEARFFEGAMPMVYVRTTEYLARSGRNDAALDMIIRGVKSHRELKGNVRLLIEQMAIRTHDKIGPAEARAYLERALKKAGDTDGAAQAASAYVRYVTKGLGEKGKFLQALVAVDEHTPLLGRTPRERKVEAKELTRQVYDAWSAAFAKVGKLEQAVAVYRKALRHFPGDEAFKASARERWHAWAKSYSDKKEWEKAAEVYSKALEMFPKDKSLRKAWTVATVSASR